MVGEGKPAAAPRAVHDKDWDADTARYYDYYWYNAHKKIDLRTLEGFGELAAGVVAERNTYLHLDRLYTLWQTAQAMPASAAAVAEVGTYQGGSAKFVAEVLGRAGRPLPFYVCDTFEGHVAVDPELDRAHAVGKQFRSTSLDRVAAYLKNYDFVRVLKGDIRETAASFAGERGFGLVHIDVDVYPITKFCLEFFATRVVPGARIVVDDYGSRTCPGVKKAVDDFVEATPAFSLFHLMTGQALLTRLA